MASDLETSGHPHGKHQSIYITTRFITPVFVSHLYVEVLFLFCSFLFPPPNEELESIITVRINIGSSQIPRSMIH